MKKLLCVAFVVGCALVNHARPAHAGILYGQWDPALTASSNKGYGVPLNATLVDEKPWSQITFQVYSEYYYSSGDASWSCYTRLTDDSSVQIALNGNAAMNLQPGDCIDETLAFSSGAVDLASYFRYKGWSTGWDPPSYGGTFGGGSVVPGYLGLMLQDDTNTYYGWMRIDVTGGTTQQLTLHEWAVNLAPGQGIVVGQQAAVPEPGSLSLLALAALLRRRRRA